MASSPSAVRRSESHTDIHYLQLNSHGQRPLFAQRSDYSTLLGLFAQVAQERHVETLAFCLLPHSIHWVLMVPEAEVAATGEWLQQEYTLRYNEQQQRNGSLFQKKIGYRQVDLFTQLAELAHQIHYLPVEGKLVPDPAIYPWSSHKHYLQPSSQQPCWLASGPLLNRIANQRVSQIRRYAQFMAPAPRDLTLINTVGLPPLAEPAPAISQEADREDAEVDWLISFICDDYQVSETDLQLWRRHRLMREVKASIAALAIRWQLADIDSLAQRLALEPDLLESGIRYLERQKPLSLHRLSLAVEHHIGPKPIPEAIVEAVDNVGDTIGDSNTDQIAITREALIDQGLDPQPQLEPSVADNMATKEVDGTSDIETPDEVLAPITDTDSLDSVLLEETAEEALLVAELLDETEPSVQLNTQQ